MIILLAKLYCPNITYIVYAWGISFPEFAILLQAQDWSNFCQYWDNISTKYFTISLNIYSKTNISAVTAFPCMYLSSKTYIYYLVKSIETPSNLGFLSKLYTLEKYECCS